MLADYAAEEHDWFLAREARTRRSGWQLFSVRMLVLARASDFEAYMLH